MKGNELLNANYVFTLPNNEQWAIPVFVIAINRAKEYAKEYDNSVSKSLMEDTLPLFEDDYFEIEDWAQNNMNFSDVEKYAFKIYTPDCEFQEGWMNGAKEITKGPEIQMNILKHIKDGRPGVFLLDLLIKLRSRK